METIASPLLWTVFSVFVLGMLALDLGVFNRKAHEVRFREALTWSVVWVALSMIFNLWIYQQFGKVKALEFLTGYVIEKALSVDNIFVFVILFASFAVPKVYQHRVLFWGVLGAILMRAVFIGLGAALVARFHWVMYVFGAILLVTGVRLLFTGESEPHPERNPIYRLGRRLIPAVPEYHGKKFFVKQAGRWFATPLFLVLLAIEATDVVFAVDSIPAIFAISTDPFIVYTSNIFAILGLRAMYFLLAGVIDKFHYLKVGLATVLIFVGVKMVIADWYKIPIAFSLAAIGATLLVSVLASILWPKPVESAALEFADDESSRSDGPPAARPR